jgi:cobalt-zinc-cadmium efflux system membrane fusion protein
MMRCDFLAATALLLSGLLLGCQRSANKHEEAGHEKPAPVSSSAAAEPDEHVDLQRRLELSEAVEKDAGIRVERVAKAVLGATLSLPGEVGADPDRVARISSPATGRLERVNFKEGERVKQGQLLAVLRVPEVAKVRASQLTALARAKAMRANAQRLRNLQKEGLAVEQDALNAESEADALEQETRSAAELLGVLGAGASGAAAISLRAPLSGTVIARDAVVGQPVTDEQALGTIADLDEVWFLARVFEKDLRSLKTGVAAEVHLNAYPDEHFAGVVEYIGQQIDPIGRTVTARVRLKNRDDLLRIGLFGTAQVALEAADKAESRLVVPQASITEVGGKSVVFVREAEHEYQLHEVTLGREALGKTEILAGLREGEIVVSAGAFTLKSLALKGSFAEEEH